MLALPRVKFDALIASGILNETCLNTLKRETKKRIQINEAKRANKDKDDSGLSPRDEELMNMEPIKLLLHDVFQTPKRFRRIIWKANKKNMGAEESVVGENTLVSKQLFLVLSKKIIARANEKGKVKYQLDLEHLWWSVNCTFGNATAKEAVSCLMVEAWMGLEDVD